VMASIISRCALVPPVMYDLLTGEDIKPAGETSRDSGSAVTPFVALNRRRSDTFVAVS